jgi:hypothetical protein
MSVILTSWEAEIRRITVPRPARAKSSQDGILTNKKLVGRVAHTYHCQLHEELRRIVVTLLSIKVKPYLKNS